MKRLLNGFKGAFRGVRRARAARDARAAVAPVVNKRPESHLHCTACGHEGEPKSHTPGSIGMEAVLWLFFIIPGVIYSKWRLDNRHDVCASCGSKALIPCDSPRAIANRKAMQS